MGNYSRQKYVTGLLKDIIQRKYIFNNVEIIADRFNYIAEQYTTFIFQSVFGGQKIQAKQMSINGLDAFVDYYSTSNSDHVRRTYIHIDRPTGEYYYQWKRDRKRFYNTNIIKKIAVKIS